MSFDNHNFFHLLSLLWLVKCQQFVKLKGKKGSNDELIKQYMLILLLHLKIWAFICSIALVVRYFFKSFYL